jgi:hypothetical protein
MGLRPRSALYPHMSYWHEPDRIQNRWAIGGKDRGLWARIRRYVPEHAYAFYLLRWEGEGYPPRMSHAADGWVELWPHGAAVVHTLEEAKQRARDLLARFDTLSEEGLEKCPRRRLRRERVQEIPHETEPLKAILFKDAEGRYEACYYRYAPMCRAPDGTLREWEWFRIRGQLYTFASDLESAEEIARLELEELARLTADAP